ncbi:MAG: hypothetical protein TR69_WS6001001025 [candidate division WS6 bacterium OLB20]|uniref:DUF4260 domain-containing protein n=1 Tax=candidate division WS6 bacterium OLB20 TaxID=1617426 RepID=A0A136LZD2_9BACT|nr:MAG: hypothetical protein TR69_WS6001001025 [candidate division WS6 bacterium OLB20]
MYVRNGLGYNQCMATPLNTLLKSEEAFLFLLGILLFHLGGFAWWLFPLLLLVPDMSMLGYLAGDRNGAALYNTFHNRSAAVLLYITGKLSGLQLPELMGIILFSHIAMDRFFGFGLKRISGFKDTHLGKLK